MNFERHLELKGKHAMFSPSQPSWLQYDEDKSLNKIQGFYRTALGTEMHEYAASQIDLRIEQGSSKQIVSSLKSYIYRKYFNEDTGRCNKLGKILIDNIKYLPKEVFVTLKSYINDAIGYRMIPEQPLVYSNYAFGTADAIQLTKNTLHIHDLKTGSGAVHIEQLKVYAALFCLEYNYKPNDLDFELSIYQMGDCVTEEPMPEEIQELMDQIKFVSKIAESELEEK